MGGPRPDAVGTGDDGPPPVSFLGRRLPPWVQLRVVVIPPGCTHAFDPGHWRATLIVVEHGAIELELHGERRVRWSQGYVGTFSGLPLRALYNGGDRTALITGLSRCQRAHANPAAGTDTSTASS